MEQNPLRDIANGSYNVQAGSNTLVANGIYGVEDIVLPTLSSQSMQGDPRLFVTEGQRKTNLRWRKVNKGGWISPKEKAQDDKDTVIQIRFNRPKKLNFIAFDLLKVPQTWVVKYYDHNRKKMVTFSAKNGEKLQGDMDGARVNVVSPRGDQSASKKWRTFKFNLPKVRTNHIEIHLNRDIVDVVDHGEFFGLPRNTPYSLGIRNLRTKYRITTDDDDDGDSTPTPIGTTERLLISRYTSTLAHDENSTSYWECAPQGAANSVVPYYLDVRQTDGTASLIDTLKMVPLWPGPRMSIYYSEDDVATPWIVSGNRELFSYEGEGVFTEGTGIAVEDAASIWTIPNTSVRADLTRSFMVGLLFTPSDTNTAGDRWLWSFSKNEDYVGLKFVPTSNGAGTMSGKFEVIQGSATGETTLFVSTETSFDFDVDTQQGIVLGYVTDDSESPRGWYLAVAEQPALREDVIYDTGTTNDALTAFFPEDINFGSNPAETKPMLGSIEKLWIRMDTFQNHIASAYLTSPEPFIFGDGDQSQRTNGYYNAILIAKLDTDAIARVGPGPGFFSNKEWSPVPVDYTLTTSMYPMPLLRAKFLKLEFTNLVPRIYLTEEPELPVRTFPQQVQDWFRTQSKNASGSPYGINSGRNRFEAVPVLPSPGDPRSFPSVRSVLEGRSGTGLPTTLYHGDMSSAEYSINPEQFDGSLRYQELEYAVTPMQFFRTGRHTYDTHFVEVQHRAFFVALKEIEVYRNDFTVQYDTPEYTETFDTTGSTTMVGELNSVHIIDIIDVEPQGLNFDLDQEYEIGAYDWGGIYVENNEGAGNGWINVGGAIQASAAGDRLTSATFESFSNFETIQMAVLDGGWESMMTQEQIDLSTLTHLRDNADGAFNGTHDTATTHYDVVTGQYQGARGGNVIEVSAFSTGVYGLRTDTTIFNDPVITGENPRTSAACRIQFPETANGKWELRIWAKDTSETYRIVTAKPIVMSTRTWKEIEVAYIALDGDHDWFVELVRTDSGVSEPLVVDMLGLWQNPVKWEVGNGPDEVQTLTLTGFAEANDSFKLTFNGQTTGVIAIQQVISGTAYTEAPNVEDGLAPEEFSTTEVTTAYRSTLAEFGDDAIDSGGAAPHDDIANTQSELVPRTFPVGAFPTNVGTQTTHTYTLGYFYASTQYGTLAEAIQAALDALSNIDPGDVTVTGSGTGPFTIVFSHYGQWGGSDIALIQVTSPVGMTGVVTETVPGGGWTTILWPLNKDTGYVRFPREDYRLKVRITALRASAIVSGWTIVPWYIESPMVMRAPIDYNPPWGISDNEDLRDTKHKPIFRLWNHWFPQRYSTNLLGLP